MDCSAEQILKKLLLVANPCSTRKKCAQWRLWQTPFSDVSEIVFRWKLTMDIDTDKITSSKRANEYYPEKLEIYRGGSIKWGLKYWKSRKFRWSLEKYVTFLIANQYLCLYNFFSYTLYYRVNSIGRIGDFGRNIQKH